MTAVKEGILARLKANWKPAVTQQYKEDPEKVKNADMKKNAEELMANPAVLWTCTGVGITLEDIEQILQEIKDEVISESNT